MKALYSLMSVFIALLTMLDGKVVLVSVVAFPSRVGRLSGNDRALLLVRGCCITAFIHFVSLRLLTARPRVQISA
jgi:hypothetical protein